MRSIATLIPILFLLTTLVLWTGCTPDRITQGSGGGLSALAATLPPPLAIGATEDAYAAALAVELPETKPLESSGLHNVYHLGENVVSGSEPHGDAAFEALAGLGIRTILSVDGKAPDLAAASRHGIRYVHVPIRYKGIEPDEMLRIAKTFRELDGPFYVHCFHGKHRGPAAAAIGRLVVDGVDRRIALAEMRQWCGTAEKYGGLYRDVAAGSIPTAEQTRAFRWDFPGRVELAGFRSAMIDIVRSTDALEELKKRDWQADPEHPDVDAVNEADKLADLFERSLQLEELQKEPEDFRRWTAEAAASSRELHRHLARREGRDLKQIAGSFRNVMRSCVACHRKYRND